MKSNPMKSNRRVLLVVVTAAVAATGSGIWLCLGSGASLAATGSPQPQVVNAVTGDAFAPGALPSGAMSSSQAVAAFEQQDPEFNPPSPMTTQAGFFFPGHGQPDGPAGRPVWALTWHECPVSHDPAVNEPIDGGVCTRWLFLDANTGDMIISEYQIPATGSADGRKAAAATGCEPKDGAAVRTLRLTLSHTQTVRAYVGDTIKVIVHNTRDRMGVPKPLTTPGLSVESPGTGCQQARWSRTIGSCEPLGRSPSDQQV